MNCLTDSALIGPVNLHGLHSLSTFIQNHLLHLPNPSPPSNLAVEQISKIYFQIIPSPTYNLLLYANPRSVLQLSFSALPFSAFVDLDLKISLFGRCGPRAESSVAAQKPRTGHACLCCMRLLRTIRELVERTQVQLGAHFELGLRRSCELPGIVLFGWRE
jgi:hypothetical protein